MGSSSAPVVPQGRPRRKGAALVLAGVVLACARPRATLVDVRTLDASIAVEMPYATTANFTGVRLYPRSRCLLRPDVAERLVRVQRRLRADGVGLLAWDCYRQFAVQRRLWALVPDARYVAEPVVAANGRPVAGSKHNRGAAVDVTLVDATGRRLEMPTAFDDFTERAHRDARDWSPVARANAARLEAAMVAEGFLPFPTEWWHFDAPGWERYELLDAPP